MGDEKNGILEREEIDAKYKWDLESMYANDELWEEDFKKAQGLAEKVTEYKGRTVESSATLLEVLKLRDELFRLTENVVVYARMRSDEDSRKSTYQALADRGMSLAAQIEEKASFIIPEILLLDESDLKKYLEEEEGLKIYAHYLEKAFGKKEHILSKEEEALLAQMGEVANSPENVFSMLNDADIKFPIIKDENNNDVEITHGNFIPLMESKDRRVRRDAFEGVYHTYKELENTFAATLNGCVKKNIFYAKARKYSSSIEASLDQNNIPVSVYDNLVESVNNNLDAMHKYMEIRKKALGLDELHMYDLYTPIVKDVNIKVPFEEAKDMVAKGLEPLGEDYIKTLKEGFSTRWIDVYENRGKRSGAYSSGTYDSKPFVLLNYHETLDNIFTTAHEMGHSMHSYFSKTTQPYIYGGYSIFLAEIASTTNECLLMDYMLKNVKDDNEKLYLLNHYLEQFRTTVYRQTMFAEFERDIHRYVENGGALTASYLNDTYKKLNEKYYGKEMIVDDEIASEWARIPHFYYNYYVFQYSTGFSSAVSLSQQILKDGEDAVDRYIGFLKSGDSDYPINVLKKAGVDMTTSEPVDSALKLFGQLVDEMSKLI
ncbi:oligoendopeptidase F [Sporanaerobacter acetigenes]|uniref:Oligopeptidase F n=1 Tax=Sporanaerobacter acetigenes DSM 13106 TaxID=1123281 RepID=A0A1M5YJH4_9FIRM|nr:oligoendopeptidase F [Sporanaerobacter acetigenes]SHI12102.1 oligopeptidase F. Metallo peptidase. MEROPS family M03B [Sporanaerobacter acetigenes DSM 13106]